MEDLMDGHNLTSRFSGALSRRRFIRNTAMSLAYMSTVGTPLARGAAPLPLSMAGYRYGRTRALIDGDVSVSGCQVAFEEAGISKLNSHVFGGPRSLDVTEIGLHPFMLAFSREKFREYTLLPIFPLRVFRHKSIFVRTDRGISSPKDLKGKTIATPGYASSSLTWIRGILQDEYGVTPQDVQWITSAADSTADVTGKASSQERLIPDGITLKAGSPGLDESDLLISGEADALFHALEPKAYTQGDPRVARLFPDSRRTEQAYFKKTGIFPIMHAVAVRRALLDQHPWLASAIFQAYSNSKQASYRQMTRLGWATDSLPWYGQELEETRALMGTNFYSYGIEGNRRTLEALFRYSHQQHLSSRLLTVEELFHPGSLDFSEESAKA
jgi:4,5-dihydroxyphthalate decarboxylase